MLSSIEPISHASLEPEQASTFRIAVADDDRLSCFLLRRRLENLGLHEIQTFNNGWGILDHLRNNPIDIVFLDLSMPDHTGYEIARAIRAGQAGEANSRCFIAAVTAEEPFHSIPMCRNAGFDWFVSKPMTERLLNTVLSRAGLQITPHPKPVWDPVYFHCPLSQRARLSS